MLKIAQILVPSLLFSASVMAQTLNGTGGNIPDNGANPTNFNLTVNGVNPSTLGGDFGLLSVCLRVTHNNLSDLQVSLMSPNGTIVPLIMNQGGTGNNFNTTCLSMTATNPITSGSAPFNGTFIPQGDINLFNDGQNTNGTWKLRIKDGVAGTSGTLNNWSITFGAMPFTSSDLPILLINTNNVSIPDDPKIPANLKIIYNGPGLRNYMTDTAYHFNDLIGIEKRGSSSQGMPKRPYGFETWTADHKDTAVSLLGMPAESDWTLIANYSDKTLMRNALSYNLANKTGHYAPRTRFCEVLLNGTYIGVYLMTEKIKRDSNRVDVAKLKHIDLTGADVTGGYIIKVDKLTGSGGDGFYSTVPPPNASGTQQIYFQYVYPKQDSIRPEQAQYIENFVDSFETALNGSGFQNVNTGWRKYMDENSVIDFFLINEMSRNVDGYRISTFLHKEKITKGNKLKMGPVWDYDIGWLNADYCSGESVTGWAYDFNNVCGNDGNLVPFWWQRFRQDTLFNKRLYCRWTELRNSFLSEDSLHNLVDSMALVLDESQGRNFVKWPILGTYVWPNPSPIPANYTGEVDKLKGWLTDRLTWMDGQINSYQTVQPMVELGNDTAICVGNSVHLIAGNYNTVQWSTGQTTPDIFAGTAGNYSVYVESLYGCHTADDIDITINPLPNDAFNMVQTANFDFNFSAEEAGLIYAWDFGDGNTSTLQSPSHTYTIAGMYTVSLSVSDTNGCAATSTQTAQTQNASVAENVNDEISVYPNPFTDLFMIKGNWSAGVQVSIVTVDGKKVYTQNKNEQTITIDATEFSSGLYYIQVKTDEGSSYSYKIIKR